MIELNLKPGDALPSQRKLAQLYGVGKSTINRALENLRAEGRVRAVSKVGWVLTSAARPDPRETHLLRVAVISKRKLQSLRAHELFQGLQKHARSRRLQLVEVPNRSDPSTPRRSRVQAFQLPWNTFDIGVLLDAEETVLSEFSDLCRDRLVAVDFDATPFGIDSVVQSDFEMGRRAAYHLHELGHTRFALTQVVNDSGFAPDFSRLERQFGFERGVGEVGGVILPEWRIPHSHRSGSQRSAFNIRRCLSEWMQRPRHLRPTALFATGGIVGAVAEHLQKLDLVVPRDLSLISITWNNTFWKGVPPFAGGLRCTALNTSIDVLTSRLIDCVKRRFSEPDRSPELHKVPFEFCPGETTSQPEDTIPFVFRDYIRSLHTDAR